MQNRKRLSWALFDTVFDGNSFRRREKVDVLDVNTKSKSLSLKSLSKVSQKPLKSLSKVSQKSLKSLSKVFQKSLKSLSKVSQKSLKVAQKWGKMSTIILQLGQYVHLPKFCAIWGKMSWGKMSLGHFVLGHFVSGAKCPWGKMSPSRIIVLKS